MSDDTKSNDVNLIYTTLREETLKRIEIRHQFITINLTVVSVFLGFGIKTHAISLLYPLLALVLATGWVHNELRIRQISMFIREKIEPFLHAPGWEHFRQQTDHETQIGTWPLNLLSSGGLFIVTQVLAISIGLINFGHSTLEWLLFIIDIPSVLALLILLWDFKRRYNLYFRTI